MKFNEYVYNRPSSDEVISKMKNAINKITEAVDFESLVIAIDEVDDIRAEVESMASIASIRNTINATDEFYEKEQEFFDEFAPVFEEYVQSYLLAVKNSKFKKEIAERYGDFLFEKIDVSLKTFKPEIIDDLQIENKLVTQYDKLKATAKIEFDGKILTIPQLSPYMQSVDREVRKNAENALYKFYEEKENEIDSIYDQLVKIRTQIAQKLGFKNFIPLAYARLNRTDYDEKMVKNYRDQVFHDLVPVANKIIAAQQKRLKVEQIMSYDLNLVFPSGNPTPRGTTFEKVATAQKMYHELSQETGVFFDFMVEHDLFDLDSKPGKVGGGYCTYIPTYKSPFIFANFNGTSHDVNVLTHEAGHAFQVFSSRDVILLDYIWPTLEACEIHSMSMEFFTWPWMQNFFKEDTDKYLYDHLTSAIVFIPYGVTVDEFQHEIYNNPDMTKDERKATWRRIEKKYTPYKVFENEMLEKGTWWYRQNHIFGVPFYYIDYTLAQVCAYQFWIKDRQNHEKAWKEYYNLCCAGGSKSFLNLLKVGNLMNPFVEGTIKKTVVELEKWIDEFDQDKIK